MVPSWFPFHHPPPTFAQASVFVLLCSGVVVIVPIVLDVVSGRDRREDSTSSVSGGDIGQFVRAHEVQFAETTAALLFVVLVSAVDVVLDLPRVVLSRFADAASKKKKRKKNNNNSEGAANRINVLRLNEWERLVFIVGIAINCVDAFILGDGHSAVFVAKTSDCVGSLSGVMTIGVLVLFLLRCSTVCSPARVFFICVCVAATTVCDGLGYLVPAAAGGLYIGATAGAWAAALAFTYVPPPRSIPLDSTPVQPPTSSRPPVSSYSRRWCWRPRSTARPSPSPGQSSTSTITSFGGKRPPTTTGTSFTCPPCTWRPWPSFCG